MSKNLYFLISIVLVLALSGSVPAATPLDVNNGSFEYDCDGNQIQREVPPTYGCIKGWDAPTGTEWFGATIWCDSLLWDGESTCNATCPTDGEVLGWIENNDIYAWQVTGSSYAANKLYTLLIDGQGECNPDISLFYGTDPCDANAVGSQVFSLATEYTCEDWVYDLKAQAVVPAGDPAVGQPIGIKIFNPLSGGYFFMDNVRLEEDWATNAYSPAPHDSEMDVAVVAMDLSWSPGLWVDKHRVYFGTDFNAVNDRHQDANKGLRDPNWYSPGTLVLSKTYYWAVDEVNTAYVVDGPPAPPNGVWPGDVWSFTTLSGDARDFSPEDGTTGVAPDVNLSWTKGPVTDCSLVYFSTSFDSVNNRLEDANEGCIGPNSFDPTPGGGILDIGTTYYWAVDEVNGAFSGSPFKSDVMEFTVQNYLVVDDFDSYGPNPALRNVWKDFYTGTLTGNGAELFLETSPDYVIDGNSMRYYFRNFAKVSGSYVGSEAEASTVDLEVGTDWAAQGVEVLVVNFYGHAENLQDTAGVRGGEHVDRMYVALEDGSANVGIVRVPDMNDIAEPEWHEWNIELADPYLSSVDMNNVVKVYIGFGGEKMGQGKAGAGKDTWVGDTVWFDDIRLWPPRCIPSYAKPKGDFDANCVIDYLDLDNIARDWLESGGLVSASPPDANLLLAWYRFEEGADQTVGNSGTGSSLDGFLGSTPAPDVCDPTWITNDPCAARQRCLEFDGSNDHVRIPGFNLTTNTATYTCWVKRNGDQIMYTIIFASLDANDPDPNDDSAITLAGLFFGSSGPDTNPSWQENSELCYYWRGESWAFQTGLIVPDGLWTFIGMTVAPDEARVYMYDGAFSSVKYTKPHGDRLFDGRNQIGGWVNPKNDQYKFVDGRIDDARFYSYTLSPGEVLYLVEPAGSVYVPLEDWRADINDDDTVDFNDYVILANNWLDEILWPAP